MNYSSVSFRQGIYSNYPVQSRQPAPEQEDPAEWIYAGQKYHGEDCHAQLTPPKKNGVQPNALQGWVRDLSGRDVDETETLGILSETRPRVRRFSYHDLGQDVW